MRTLLGPDGLPLVSQPLEGRKNGSPVMGKSLFSAMNTYIASLQKTRMSATVRAMDPFSNHAWVFAAAAVTSQVASQAEFVVFRETDQQVRARIKSAGGRWSGPRAGRQRRAMQRHDVRKSQSRVLRKGIVPDYNHPVMDLLHMPNPLQSKEQLFQLTYLWLAVRGEVFWVLTDDEGGPPGQQATRIWPLSPDCFEPRFSGGDQGDLVGWWYRPPRWMPNAATAGRLPLDLTEVVQFKFPNPMDPVRGMSRLTAVALGIETDLMVQSHNKALLANSAVPKGVITHEDALSAEEESAYLQRWKDKHEGVQNAARIALLSGGFKYQSIALTPEDMDFIESRKMTREEVLAVMGTPPSVLGVTEFTNYATQLGQDKNFWDKSIMPYYHLIEATLDRSVFFDEVDTVFGGYDVSSIEALRAGLREKVEIAERLSSDKLHVPPKVAFELVDLEVPEYEGDDTALVAALATPVEDVLMPPEPVPQVPTQGPDGTPADQVPTDQAPPGQDQPSDPNADPQAEQQATASRGPWVRRSEAQRKAASGRRWRQFQALEISLETKMRRAYRNWVTQMRNETLAAFDDSAKAYRRRFAKQVDLTLILPDIFDAAHKLKENARPTMTGTLAATYEFTLDDIGIPTFGIDDSRLITYFDLREKKFITTTPKTLIDNLRKTLTEGISAGESLSQLRLRVAQVYDISASSHKSLQVARTETSNLMNGVRDQMFGAQGFTKQEWVSAGDEVTRPDHVLFGEQGPQDRGFNYLTLPNLVNGTGGSLAYPGDLAAPAGQVINCRCMMIPTE